MDHIELANRNHLAMEHLLVDPAKFAEWIATTAFYKAVQVVEAMLTKAGRSRQDHRSRHDLLKRLYPEIWKHYRILWTASCVARYLHDNDNATPYTRFSDYMTPGEIESRLLKKRLRSVEQLVVSSLSDNAKDNLSRVP